MKLIITDSIYKDEFEPLQKTFGFNVVKVAAKKSLQGHGDNIKNSLKIPNTTLSKIYLTGKCGAGRAIFLLVLADKKSVLVMIRTKNDKKISSNMTLKNPQFQKILEKNIKIIIDDLERGNYLEYDCND